MRRGVLFLLWIMVCVPLGAQTTHRDSVLSRARYLKSIYRTDEAVELLSGLVTPGTMDVDVLSELADCHFQSGDYEGAAGTYYMLSAQHPENLLCKVRLMQVYSRLKAWPQSIEAGREVLRLDSIPAVLSLVGDSFRQLEEADSALWYYRRSLALNPRSEATLSKAMNVLLSAENYDEAIGLAGRFLEEDPDNPIVAPLQGLAYFRKADYDAAVAVFQRQEDIGNDSYAVHSYLGQSYWHTNILYRAEEELLAAWQIDSSDVNLAYSIAAVKSEITLPFEAEVKPWLDKAWEMIQPNPAIMSRLHQEYGLGYYRKQNAWKQAIGHYKEAYRYNPKFTSALSTIGYCYEQMKDYDHALEWYEKYLKEARPGTPSYDFVVKSIDYIKSERFMTSGD